MRVTHTFLFTYIIILGSRVTHTDTGAPDPGRTHGPGTHFTKHLQRPHLAPQLLSASPGTPRQPVAPQVGTDALAMSREHRAHALPQTPTDMTGFKARHLPVSPSAQGSRWGAMDVQHGH